MAKNAFLDWSGTATDNTDLAGLSTLGSAPVSNFDNIIREMMAQLRLALGGAATPVSQPEAIAGAVSETRGWSPLRDRQAIEAISSRGTNIRGSFNAQNVSTGLVELGSADFTATGPAVLVSANLSIDGVSATIVRARLDIVRVDNSAVVYQGPTIAMNHQASNTERLPAAADFVGLTRGVLYRARVIASADAGTVAVAGFINGICA